MSEVESRAQKCDERLQESYMEAMPWILKAYRAQRYYNSEQWDNYDPEQDRNRMTHNVIRRDMDFILAGITEADPVMEAQGRGAEDFDLGLTWKDLLRFSEEWRGEQYDSCKSQRRRVYTNMVHLGEGIEKVIWVPDEENGLGFVVSISKDPRYFVWDPAAYRSLQKRDAKYCIEFEPLPIEDLDLEYSKFKGQFTPDAPGLFIKAFEQAKSTEYRALLNLDGSLAIQSPRFQKAYKKEQWEKKQAWEVSYTLKSTKQVAEVEKVDEETEKRYMAPMTEEDYDNLRQREKALYSSTKRKTWKIYRSVFVNRHEVEKEEESIYDHGAFPYAWYSNVWDASQTHARGEIEYLTGYQDIINRALSRWLEAMFIGVSQITAIQKGSAPKGELEKLDNRGRRPMQSYYYYPGQPLPAVIAGSPTVPQLFQAGIQMLQQAKSDQSTVQDTNRQAVQYELSGKAISNLASEREMYSSLIRAGVEEGLTQATWLRLSILRQFMRGHRLARISSRAAGEQGYSLFMGEDEEQVKTTFGLQPEKRTISVPGGGVEQQATGDYTRSKNGEKGKILIISDRDVQKFDLKLVLDTGRSQRKSERQQLVTMFFNYLGPAAGVEIVKWAADMLEVPNPERLYAGLDKEDAKAKAVQLLQQAQEQTGMGVDEMVGMIMEMKARAGQGENTGGPAPGGPAGAPVPPEAQPQPIGGP